MLASFRGLGFRVKFLSNATRLPKCVTEESLQWGSSYSFEAELELHSSPYHAMHHMSKLEGTQTSKILRSLNLINPNP